MTGPDDYIYEVTEAGLLTSHSSRKVWAVEIVLAADPEYVLQTMGNHLEARLTLRSALRHAFTNNLSADTCVGFVCASLGLPKFLFVEDMVRWATLETKTASYVAVEKVLAYGKKVESYESIALSATSHLRRAAVIGASLLLVGPLFCVVELCHAIRNWDGES